MKNFTGEFTDADKVIVDALYNKMKQDSKVKRATKTDVNAVFSRQFLKILNKRLILKIWQPTSNSLWIQKNTALSKRHLLNAFIKICITVLNKFKSEQDTPCAWTFGFPYRRRV